MKTLFIILSGMVVLSMLAVSVGWCHGVEGAVDQVKAYCVTAQYDDGEPMSYAAVEIKAPQSDIVFQNGRTDRNGCFMIKTDTPGAWQAVVSDGMGHRLALDFAVAADGDAETRDHAITPAVPAKMSRPLKVLAGLSIIFGLCGFFYGWKARRSESNKN
jgi:nickel transport protein